jgi:uncharacterized membrane protein
MKEISQPKTLYKIITIASSVGLVASFLQMLEKLILLENPNAVLTCDINSVFSCTNILNSWQSSVFGFPNTLMCIIYFSLLLAIGLVGWTGSNINKKLRLTLQGMTLFFIGFGFWYLWQSIFAVGGLCIFCMFCYGAVLFISGSMLRLNYKDYSKNKSVTRFFENMIAKQYDILIWIFIAIAIIIETIIKFA